MEKKKVIISVVLIVWVLALLFTFYYIYNTYIEITSPNTAESKLNSQFVELYTISPLSADKLMAGGDVDIVKGDIIPVTIKKDDYSIKVYEVNGTSKTVDLFVNNFLYFTLKNQETKKLDLNGDNYYDLLLTLKSVGDDKATLFLRTINEKRAISDSLDEALSTIKQNSAMQSRLMILIFLIFIIILVLYLIKFYLAPAIGYKRKMAREKPANVMDYLLTEFDKEKKINNEKNARKIATKINSLYEHMTNSDKENYSNKIKNVKKYLN